MVAKHYCTGCGQYFSDNQLGDETKLRTNWPHGRNSSSITILVHRSCGGYVKKVGGG